MATRGGYEQNRPTWFNSANYTGFDWVADQPYQELQHIWSKALQLRQKLVNLPPELKAECIEKLIINPLDDCGFESLNFVSHKELLWNKNSPPDQVHRYGQPTVSPTRCGHIPKDITNFIEHHPSICLDNLYQSSLSHSSPTAFLTINLAASNSLIKKDFNNWLLKIRRDSNFSKPFTARPETLIETWASYKLIQCIDLIKIIGPAKGDRISSAKAAEWAQVGPDVLTDTFITRTLRKVIEEALRPETSSYLVQYPFHPNR